jgi:hypothetical protein
MHLLGAQSSCDIACSPFNLLIVLKTSQMAQAVLPPGWVVAGDAME